MTDKEKKSKIADILMDFQEEYSNDVINRPMLASLYAGNILSFIDSMQKEPVNKDLGEYINELSKQFIEVSFAKLSRIAVRVAKWQKEQLIKQAIDGYVIEDIEEGNGDFLLSCEYLPKNMGLVDQQKVKVIIIKED